jgi:superfamily II DNA or RNA helicase
VTVLAEPATEWPEGVLFWPSRQIPWQTDYVARMAAMKAALLVADMGTGKTVMSLGVAGILLEFGLIDGVLVVCERNKLTEWAADFGTFTRIDAAVYHGPKRKRLLEDLPTAVITTYETCRDDIAVFPPKKSGKRALLPGPLMEVIAGRRMLVVYDEITKLGRRTSNLYKAHYWMCGQLRKAQPDATYALGLTATPMDTDLDNVFNEVRLIVPHAMPTVAAYEDRVIRSRHPVYGTPTYRAEGKEWFRSLCEPWILRKRKSDPDVREYFPPLTERFVRIQMHQDQFSLYRSLEDLAWDDEGNHRDVPGLNALLRQLAGDPWAVLEAGRTGDSALARMVAEECAEELQKCSSAKAEELISLADLVMSSGGKLLAFTFFGQTVLPALARRLEGRPVFTYHGGQTVGQQEQQKQAFKAYPRGAVLLASDAGARGINMPEISYAVEYEVARTHALRMQRAGRGHRLGKVDPLTFITLVLDSSIEGSRAIRSLMTRNLDSDFMLGDEDAEGYTTAEDRRALFAQARPRKAGAPQ